MALSQADGSSIVEKSPSPYEGRFGRFERRLGEGAAKIVYEAIDLNDGKLVAWNEVDIAHLSSEQRDTVIAEVDLLRSIQHPHIIDFYGAWSSTGKVIFITEIVESGDLQRFYKTHHIKLKVMKKWCRQILSALMYLHSFNPPIIHRDVKCENILYNAADGTLKVGDFGLCTSAVLDGAKQNAAVATPGRPAAVAGVALAGTPNYMAPEMYEDSYDEGVDIYAFGMCVLEMLTRRLPYDECSNAAQIYKRVVTGVRPESLTRVTSDSVAAFIEFCTGKDPVTGLRPTAPAVLSHPFLSETGCGSGSGEDDAEVTSLVAPEQGSRVRTGTGSAGIGADAGGVVPVGEASEGARARSRSTTSTTSPSKTCASPRPGAALTRLPDGLLVIGMREGEGGDEDEDEDGMDGLLDGGWEAPAAPPAEGEDGPGRVGYRAGEGEGSTVGSTGGAPSLSNSLSMSREQSYGNLHGAVLEEGDGSSSARSPSPSSTGSAAGSGQPQAVHVSTVLDEGDDLLRGGSATGSPTGGMGEGYMDPPVLGQGQGRGQHGGGREGFHFSDSPPRPLSTRRVSGSGDDGDSDSIGGEGVSLGSDTGVWAADGYGSGRGSRREGTSDGSTPLPTPSSIPAHVLEELEREAGALVVRGGEGGDGEEEGEETGSVDLPPSRARRKGDPATPAGLLRARAPPPRDDGEAVMPALDLDGAGDEAVPLPSASPSLPGVIPPPLVTSAPADTGGGTPSPSKWASAPDTPAGASEAGTGMLASPSGGGDTGLHKHGSGGGVLSVTGNITPGQSLSLGPMSDGAGALFSPPPFLALNTGSRGVAGQRARAVDSPGYALPGDIDSLAGLPWPLPVDMQVELHVQVRGPALTQTASITFPLARTEGGGGVPSSSSSLADARELYSSLVDAMVDGRPLELALHVDEGECVGLLAGLLDLHRTATFTCATTAARPGFSVTLQPCRWNANATVLRGGGGGQHVGGPRPGVQTHSPVLMRVAGGGVGTRDEGAGKQA